MASKLFPTLSSLEEQLKLQEEAALKQAEESELTDLEKTLGAVNDPLARQTQSALAGIQTASQFAFGDTKPDLTAQLQLSEAQRKDTAQSLTASEKAAQALKERAAKLGQERGKISIKREELQNAADQKEADRLSREQIADSALTSMTVGDPLDPTRKMPIAVNRKGEEVFRGTPYKNDSASIEARTEQRRQQDWIEKRKSELNSVMNKEELTKRYSSTSQAKAQLNQIKARIAAGEKIGTTGALNALVTQFARSLQPGVLTDKDWERSNAADAGFLEQLTKWKDEKILNEVNLNQLNNLERILSNMESHNFTQVQRVLDGFTDDVNVVNRERGWSIDPELVLPGNIRNMLPKTSQKDEPNREKASAPVVQRVSAEAVNKPLTQQEVKALPKKGAPRTPLGVFNNTQYYYDINGNLQSRPKR